MAQTAFAYGSVLEALSRGLYPDKRHIIREFVQNAFDSIYELRKAHPKIPVSPIEIKIQSPSITIADRGIGMTETQVEQYRYLGFSQKERSKHAGFRGIGKYSGSAVAEKLIVDSSPYGVAKRFRAVIHADRMMQELKSGKNPPLEYLLEQHTEVTHSAEDANAHYTFVELHRIASDADVLMDVDDIRGYLARTAPVPLDPNFQHSARIEAELRENIPEFLAVPLTVNGTAVFKNFFPNCLEPAFDPILFDDNKPEVLAFCWYCQNAGKGQFEPKELAGLTFRAKNIAVGDGRLSRKMLWKSTPERALYFFGEIHVLDDEVIPSSDRTDFEDNKARTRLAERCARIASNLNRKAGDQAQARRFVEVVDKSTDTVKTREAEIKAGTLPSELREQVVFEMQKIQEDVNKRLTDGKNIHPRATATRAKRLVGRTRRLLQTLRTTDSGFVDLEKMLRMDAKARALYDTIMEVLREEFRHDTARLERIVRHIHDAVKTRFKV
jgi:hypothetical protein